VVKEVHQSGRGEGLRPAHPQVVDETLDRIVPQGQDGSDRRIASASPGHDICDMLGIHDEQSRVVLTRLRGQRRYSRTCRLSPEERSRGQRPQRDVGDVFPAAGELRRKAAPRRRRFDHATGAAREDGHKLTNEGVDAKSSVVRRRPRDHRQFDRTNGTAALHRNTDQPACSSEAGMITTRSREFRATTSSVKYMTGRVKRVRHEDLGARGSRKARACCACLGSANHDRRFIPTGRRAARITRPNVKPLSFGWLYPFLPWRSSRASRTKIAISTLLRGCRTCGSMRGETRRAAGPSARGPEAGCPRTGNPSGGGPAMPL